MQALSIEQTNKLFYFSKPVQTHVTVSEPTLTMNKCCKRTVAKTEPDSRESKRLRVKQLRTKRETESDNFDLLYQ